MHRSSRWTHRSERGKHSSKGPGEENRSPRRGAEVSRLEESEKRLEELRAMRRTARSPAHTSCRCFLVGGPSQEEMNATFLFGEPFRSSRISGLIHQEFPTSCCFPIHGDQRGEVMRVPRRTVSRYGLRGTRVGEASNPGLRPEETSSPKTAQVPQSRQREVARVRHPSSRAASTQ